MSRSLPPASVRMWAENWAGWLRDQADCYPQAYVVASAEGQYRCPQRNHHHAPSPAAIPIYPIPAATLETLIADWIDRPDLRRARIALKVEYVTHPASTLRLRTLESGRWAEIRATAAHMVPRTYWEALSCAYAHLASILWPHRWELPRAEAANR